MRPDFLSSGFSIKPRRLLRTTLIFATRSKLLVRNWRATGASAESYGVNGSARATTGPQSRRRTRPRTVRRRATRTRATPSCGL